MSAVNLAVGVLLFILSLEIILRFYSLYYSPLSVKIAYAFFLMSPKKTEEAIAQEQRIRRGGFNNLKQLFEYYEKIAVKPYQEIKSKFGLGKNWLSLFNNKYYSGGHAAIGQVQKMHLGWMPKPGQKLQTLNINDDGLRDTGYAMDKIERSKNYKVCLLLGGSVMFGVGATSDNNTIGGKIASYLNNNNKLNSKFIVINHGMFGFNSLQELISLLQFNIKPDYVISLSGWNEIDQQTSSHSKVAGLAEGCEHIANMPIYKKLIKNVLSPFVIISVIKRFVTAFILFDTLREESKDFDAVNIYPLF